MIGLAAAEALGSEAPLGDLHAATAAIGVSPEGRQGQDLARRGILGVHSARERELP
jgi:hypothetical protein